MPSGQNMGRCPVCGSENLEQVTGAFNTQIEGPQSRLMNLSVPNLRWQHCNACGEDVLDDVASRAITKAHRSTLKLLTAEEIRSLREALGKTQAEMADLLGVGEKTFTRWESGSHFQTEAFDRYLRLLQRPEVVHLLNDIKLYKEGGSEFPSPQFQYLEVAAYEGISESRKRSSPATWFTLQAA